MWSSNQLWNHVGVHTYSGSICRWTYQGVASRLSLEVSSRTPEQLSDAGSLMCITDMLACVNTCHVILVNVLDCIHVCEVYNIILLMYYEVINEYI